MGRLPIKCMWYSILPLWATGAQTSQELRETMRRCLGVFHPTGQGRYTIYFSSDSHASLAEGCLREIQLPTTLAGPVPEPRASAQADSQIIAVRHLPHVLEWGDPRGHGQGTGTSATPCLSHLLLGFGTLLHRHGVIRHEPKSKTNHSNMGPRALNPAEPNSRTSWLVFILTQLWLPVSRAKSTALSFAHRRHYFVELVPYAQNQWCLFLRMRLIPKAVPSFLLLWSFFIKSLLPSFLLRM